MGLIFPQWRTGGNWFENIAEYISQFDPGWTQRLKPESIENLLFADRYPSDYRDFFLRAGKSGCRFQTPLLRHSYFSAAEMETFRKEFGREDSMVAFGTLDDEYESALLLFEDSGVHICCPSMCSGSPAADSFRHLFCGSVFLDFGVRQFAHRIGFAEERQRGEAQIPDILCLLKQKNFTRQWFSTEINRIWTNDRSCCVISIELKDAIHISFFVNHLEDCRSLIDFLETKHWEEDLFFENFPQWS